MTIAELMVKLGLDSSQFTKGLEDTNTYIGEVQGTVDKQVGNVTSALGDLQGIGLGLTAGVTVPLLAIGAAAVKVSEQFTAANIGFTTMLGSAEKASSFLKDLQKFAAETPFEFSDLTSAAQRMMALGFSAEQVIPTLRTVGDTVAASGTMSREQIDGIILALGQMQAKQKVSAQEMQQLAERGIPAWEILSKAIGVSVPEAMKLAEKGVIKASDAIPALLEGMRTRSEGSMEKMSHTLTGVWSNFEDQATMTLAKMGNTLAPVVLSLVQNALLPMLESLDSMVQWFTNIPEPVQGFILGLAGIAAAIGPVLLGLATFGQAIISIKGGLAIIGPALTGWNAALGLSVGAMAGWVAAIGVGIAAIYSLVSAYNSMKEAQQGLQDAQNSQANGMVRLRESLLNNKNATEENKKEIINLGNAYRNNSISETQYLQGLQKVAKEIGSKVTPATKELTKEEKMLADLQKKMQDALAGTQKAHKKTAEEVEADRKAKANLRLELDRFKKSNDAFAKQYDKVNNETMTQARVKSEEAMKAMADFGVKLAEVGDKGRATDIALSPLLITLGELKAPTDRLRDALSELGIQSASSYEAVAINAERAYEAVLQSGNATQWEKDSAMVKVLEAQIAAAKAAGEQIPAEWGAMLEALKSKTGTKLPEVKGQWEGFGKEVSTVVTNFTQDIAKSLFDGDMSWGEKFKSMLSSLGSAVVSSFIQPATTAIAGFISGALADLIGGKGFGGIMDSITGIGGAIGKLFGSGASAASGAAGAAGSVGGAAGGVGQAIGGTVTGIVGAVGSVVGAISGIIGNFQNARQETTLNAIEHEVRYSQIHLLHLLEKANETWPSIDMIHSRMWAWTGEGLGVKQFDQAGWRLDQLDTINENLVNVRPNVNITVNVDNADAKRVADQIVGELRLAGVMP